jgi:hypothetical protein
MITVSIRLIPQGGLCELALDIAADMVAATAAMPA